MRAKNSVAICEVAFTGAAGSAFHSPPFPPHMDASSSQPSAMSGARSNDEEARSSSSSLRLGTPGNSCSGRCAAASSRDIPDAGNPYFKPEKCADTVLAPLQGTSKP
ncbi:hypothetical protein SNK04_014261 [Fusarium graminearum]